MEGAFCVPKHTEDRPRSDDLRDHVAKCGNLEYTEVGPLYTLNMQRDIPFSVGEIFHVYNRGANKMTIYESETDYVRFLHLLYLCNQKIPTQLGNLTRNERGRSSVYSMVRGGPIVDVLAYCLMPNHFHLVLRECGEGGISEFMKKVATGYSMYFNHSRERTGTLFQGRFKAKHVGTDAYFNHIFSYVHLNPAELSFGEWQTRVQEIKPLVANFVLEYPYSSCKDHFGHSRLESVILTLDDTLGWKERIQTPNDMFNFLEP